MAEETPTPLRPCVPGESVSKAASELNNLLQIISGTSDEMENLCGTSAGSDKYLEMLHKSIERAETIAAQLAEEAGGAPEKVLMNPELSAFIKPREVKRMPSP